MAANTTVANTGKTNNDLFITNERAAASRRAAKTESKGKTIFAGNMKKPTDLIAMKRQQAQKKASKLVGDVFKSAKKVESDMSAMLDKVDELREQRIEDKDSIRQLEDSRANLMEYYNVSEDSEEYDNLELLRKERDSKNPLSGITLTEEEEGKLSEIHKAGVTDFQKEMLAIDNDVKEYEGKVTSGEKAIDAIYQAFGDLKVELLKSEPMQEAEEEAEDILMAANKEIIGDLRKEAVDHVEEKLEDVVEAAKKKAEKQKEEDKKLDKRKEKQDKLDKKVDKAQSGTNATDNTPPVQHNPLDKVIDNLSLYSTQSSKVGQKLEKIMDELDLIMEDLKGTEVDVNI